MRFQYLGTAAAEGWPAVFCNCEFCKKAQALGGPNIRTRAQAIINDDLLLDFNMDTYLHKLQFQLDLTRVRYLLVTHCHMDHFYPQELTIRGSGYSHDMVSEDLHIYCAKEVKDYFYLVGERELDEATNQHLFWHLLEPFRPEQAGPYTITPLPATHMRPGNQPFVYHICDEAGREVYYLHDSGTYKDEVWEYFQERARQGKTASLISLDATSGYRETDHGGHMGFPECFRTAERLRQIGLASPKTHIVLNHFSHNGHYLYDEQLALAQPKGIEVSYDGMVVEM